MFQGHFKDDDNTDVEVAVKTMKGKIYKYPCATNQVNTIYIHHNEAS